MPNKNDFISPQFGVWEEKSPRLALAMTKWLYGDPKANPLWNKPSEWATGPRVQIVKRSLDFTNIASGSNDTQKLSLVGGKNAIVLGRMATIKLHAVPGAPLQLPNEYGSYVKLEQRRTDGWLDIQDAPMNNSFGTVPGWPDMTPSPEFWLGNSDRTIVVTNGWGAPVTVTVSWSVALLDTGR
jgi:hypothetical protein